MKSLSFFRPAACLQALAISCLALLATGQLAAQTQTIRGTIVDKETRQPLAGSMVKLATQGADTSLKAVADA